MTVVSESFAHGAKSRQDEDPSLERRSMHRLLDRLRVYQVGRVAFCGIGACYGRTEIEIQRVDGHCRLDGIFRCGSVWSCPVCALRIHAERAKEVTAAIDWWGIERVVLLTLTFRHKEGDDLAWTRRELSKTWARFQQSRWWRQTFKPALGLEHFIRVQEVTHGENGFHPHLHTALFVAHPELVERDDLVAELRKQWAAHVSSCMGRKYQPNDHGADLRPCHRADYLQKLGLEVAWSKSKTGAGTSIWELMAEVAAHGRGADVQLWRQYCAAYKGARQLAWSLGLKKLYEADQLTDQQIADGEGSGGDSSVEMVAAVPKETWAPFAKHRGSIARLIELVEKGGNAEQVGELFRKVLDAPVGSVAFNEDDRRLRWRRDEN